MHDSSTSHLFRSCFAVSSSLLRSSSSALPQPGTVQRDWSPTHSCRLPSCRFGSPRPTPSRYLSRSSSNPSSPKSTRLETLIDLRFEILSTRPHSTLADGSDNLHLSTLPFFVHSSTPRASRRAVSAEIAPSRRNPTSRHNVFAIETRIVSPWHRESHCPDLKSAIFSP